MVDKKIEDDLFKALKFSEQKVDLSTFEFNEYVAKFVQDNLKQFPNIEEIVWSSEYSETESIFEREAKQLKDSIKKLLEENRENFRELKKVLAKNETQTDLSQFEPQLVENSEKFNQVKEVLTENETQADFSQFQPQLVENKEKCNEVKEFLAENETQTDLSQFQPQLDKKDTFLIYVLKSLDKLPNISLIKWPQTLSSLTKQSHIDLMNKIEDKLIQNIKNYEKFANHYRHGLFSRHAYLYAGESTKTIGVSEIDQRATDHFKEKYKKLHDDGWEVKQVNKEEGFTSILYINKMRKQLVLTFKGVQLGINDFFLKDNNQIEATVYGVLGNLDIANQTILAYEKTKECVKLSRKLGGYSLSFTGYSFGAWLAEQSVYFARRDFRKKDVCAITFESPGSNEYLEKLNTDNINSKDKFDLTDLDIVTYLSEPNFVNTCNTHVNKVYRLYLDRDENVKNGEEFARETNDFIEKTLIKNLPSFVQNKIKGCYESLIKNNVSSYYFYLNGIKSFFSNGLVSLLKQFDAETEKPIKYRRVRKWPKVDFKPSPEMKNNFLN